MRELVQLLFYAPLAPVIREVSVPECARELQLEPDPCRWGVCACDDECRNPPREFLTPA